LRRSLGLNDAVARALSTQSEVILWHSRRLKKAEAGNRKGSQLLVKFSFLAEETKEFSERRKFEGHKEELEIVESEVCH
jgi:hypothetical protein